MPKVIFRQEAINDLTDIWYYTLYKWSENQADIYYNDLKKACWEIGENPQMGKEYNEIRQHLMGIKSGKHLIFYHQISQQEVEIIRILHERMDLKSRLRN